MPKNKTDARPTHPASTVPARPTHDASAAKRPKAQYFHTRVSTGKALHAFHVEDHRTMEGRRFAELYAAICADIGGEDTLSELQKQSVRRAAGLSTALERMESSLAEGGEYDEGKAALLTNSFNRTAAAIGLRRSVKNITPTLADMVAAKRAAALTVNPVTGEAA